MIEKIIASDIVVADFDYTYGLLSADTIIYDATRKIDIQPKDSPNIKLLIELCRDPLFMNSMSMKMANQERGGCLEVWVDGFQYTIQFCSGIPFYESLREDSKWKILVGSIEDDNLIPLQYTSPDRPVPNPSISDASMYYVLQFTTFGDTIRENLGKVIVRDSNFYNRLPKLMIIDYDANKRKETVDLYNTYLEKVWRKKIIIQESILLPNYMIQDLSRAFRPLYPMASEGSGFHRFLHYIDAFKESKDTGLPLIIENFGEGLYNDKIEALFDIIGDFGIHVSLSTSD